LTFNGIHDVISQKMAPFTATAVRTSNLTEYTKCGISQLTENANENAKMSPRLRQSLVNTKPVLPSLFTQISPRTGFAITILIT
jgi:hypothetical protein